VYNQAFLNNIITLPPKHAQVSLPVTYLIEVFQSIRGAIYIF